MRNLLDSFNALTLALLFGARNFVTRETARIKNDESGMELLQVILIIVAVVVIAGALFGFLMPWVQSLMAEMDPINPSTDY